MRFVVNKDGQVFDTILNRRPILGDDKTYSEEERVEYYKLLESTFQGSEDRIKLS